MWIKRMASVATLGALAMAACRADARPDAEPAAEAPAATASYTDIDAAELSAMMRDKDFVLVNVHVPYEGEIPGTDVHIPYDAIDGALDRLGGEDAKIVLYCRSGGMSTTAATRLVELGYTQLYHLAGGMREWTGAGYELVHREGGE